MNISDLEEIKFNRHDTTDRLKAFIEQERMLTKSQAEALVLRIEDLEMLIDELRESEEHSCEDNCDRAHVGQWDFEIIMTKKSLVDQIDFEEHPAAEQAYDLLEELYNSY